LCDHTPQHDYSLHAPNNQDAETIGHSPRQNAGLFCFEQ
jgi:hypothetical protein